MCHDSIFDLISWPSLRFHHSVLFISSACLSNASWPIRKVRQVIYSRIKTVPFSISFISGHTVVWFEWLSQWKCGSVIRGSACKPRWIKPLRDGRLSSLPAVNYTFLQELEQHDHFVSFTLCIKCNQNCFMEATPFQ